ncbi:uncharacterized protein LOC121858681 isoform X1 [Homarus americanus]|uniref:Uncharacterized protein n=1 Tax=Homarus americanus TaxID=6706 RepID=A0A8J5N8H8_HOMAM|nr:uncharacterized protein LOC121858681 isoform X1 [Homarus americanus]KAG7175032.1 hypothetical protein Hamer_G015245 [Homarus americanus]
MVNICGKNISMELCVLSFLLVLSIAGIMAGIAVLQVDGFSEKSMIILCVSGIIWAFVLFCLKLSLKTYSTATPSSGTSSPQSDPPPDYRNTWRLEYIKKSPDSLREELEGTITPPNKVVVPRRNINSIWTSSSEVGVHGATSPTADTVYVISEGGSSSGGYVTPKGRQPFLFTSGITEIHIRPGRAYTLPANLPSTSQSSSQQGTGATVIPGSSLPLAVPTDYDESLPRYQDLGLA